MPSSTRKRRRQAGQSSAASASRYSNPPLQRGQARISNSAGGTDLTGAKATPCGPGPPVREAAQFGL